MKLELSQLIELLDNDMNALHAVLMAYIDAANEIVDQLKQHFQNDQCQGVEDCAHKLKSAARSIGANDLSDLCESLEAQAKSAGPAELQAMIENLLTTSDQVNQHIAEHYT